MARIQRGSRGEVERRVAVLAVLTVLAALAALLPRAVAGQVVARADAPRVRLSLSDAVDHALRGSEVVEVAEVAEAGLLRARGDRVVARSGFLPRVSGQAGHRRTLASEFSGLAAAPDSGPGTFEGLQLPFGQRDRYEVGAVVRLLPDLPLSHQATALTDR
jgi:outer membrane protein TolC